MRALMMVAALALAGASAEAVVYSYVGNDLRDSEGGLVVAPITKVTATVVVPDYLLSGPAFELYIINDSPAPGIRETILNGVEVGSLVSVSITTPDPYENTLRTISGNIDLTLVTNDSGAVIRFASINATGGPIAFLYDGFDTIERAVPPYDPFSAPSGTWTFVPDAVSEVPLPASAWTILLGLFALGAPRRRA